MPGIARDHHFIPQFFLGNFTPSGTKDDFLWVTDRKELRAYPAKPCSVGFHKDLYRVNVGKARPDVIEQIFAQFEGYAAPTVKHVLERQSLPPRPEFDHLMELVGLLHIRVPVALQRVHRMLDEFMKRTFRPSFKDVKAVRAMLDKMQADGIELPEGKSYDQIDCEEEELVQFVQQEDIYTLSLDRDWLLGQMLATSVPAQLALFERTWSIHVAKDDAGEFICSDAPVCLTWRDPKRCDRIARLYDHDTDVTIPLGKRIALHGRYEEDLATRIDCNRGAVAHVNTRTISSGDRFLYSGSRDFPWERDDGSIGNWDDLIADIKAPARKRKSSSGDRPTV